MHQSPLKVSCYAEAIGSLGFLGIVAVSLLWISNPDSARSDTLSIYFPPSLGTDTGLQTSTGGSLNGFVVRAGALTGTASQLISNLAGKTTSADILTTINSSFWEYSSFSMADAYLSDPSQAIATLSGSMNSANLKGKDIYLLFYNSATASGANEIGIFRMANRADVPGEGVGVFPTSDDGFGTRTSLFIFSDPDQLVGPESFLNLLVGQYNATTESYTLGALEGGIGQITSPLTETNASGVVSTYQITANNGADRFYATTNTANADLTLTTLPTGFSIATNTGVITARTNAAANTYSIRLVASNSLTASVATNTLIWTLQASTLSFTTTTNLISAVAGVQISPFTFVSTGTSPTYTAGGNLRGLILSTNGLLSGIPSSVGTNDVTITSSAGGQNGTTTFSLAVAAPTISVPAGELTGGQIVHTAGTARTVTLNKSAGFTDLEGQVIPSTSGVTFNGTDLVIAADAVPLLRGLNNITLTLTASKVGGSGVSASTTVPLRIVAPTPTALVGPTEFEVDVGQAFSTTILSDAGAYGRMSFSNLPSGLVGNQNGVVAGINSSRNLPYEFLVKVVADSTQIYEGGGTFTNTNVIFRLRNTNAPVITSATTANARVGQPFHYTIQASGSPFQYEALGLPPGLTLNGQNIIGTPTQVGNFNVTLAAYNSYRPGSTNPAYLQSGTATLSIQVMAKNQSSYAFDGNLNNSLGESSLSGESLVYTTDRRGNSGKAVRTSGVNGLTRSSSVPDITSDATVAFWFKMPETEIPAEGWWLFSSGSLGVKLLPDPAGTKVQVVGLESRWGVPLADQFTQTLGTWSAGSGWHHLCIRLCDSNWPVGARVFYDGAELVYLPAYNEYRGMLDLNNFCLGSKTGSADGSFFPGEFDDFVLYDGPLGIYEPSEWSYPGLEHSQYEDFYANPTISELYLGLPRLTQNRSLFGLGIYPSAYGQYDSFVNESPYDVLEIESFFGIVALQDNGDLYILDSLIGVAFQADPNDPWHHVRGGRYSRGSCDPRMLYGNARAVAGPLHLIVLKKNGDVVEQKRGTGGYDNQLGNVTTHYTGCIAVAAGFNVGMALGADGLVRVWHPFPEGTQGLHPALFALGRPLEYGQTSIPITARNCVAIAAGEEHCLALTAEGRVVAWGNNDVGQTTVPVAALTDVVKIAAGPFSSIALRKDGTVITWGDNKADSQNPPAAWQGHFRDIVAGWGMMGGVTDLGRPILWSHGPETGYALGAPEVPINDESLRTLSMSLPSQVSKLTTGNMSYLFGLGGLVTYETKTAVPFWKVQIPQKVAVPEQSSLRLDLRTFLTTSAIPNLRFEAIGLPEGSSLDSATGTLVISNPPTSPRAVQILARNDQGLDRWTFILQSGAQGVGLQPLPVTESMSPIKLAELMVPSGWSSLTPLDPSRYEVKVVGDRMEIWSTGGLDYENSADRSLTITISALDLAGGVQTATSAIILGNNSSEDADHDGLLEIYEQFYGTSDLLADSDGDLFADLYEIQHGTSPSQASANPGIPSISLQKSLTEASFSLEFLAPLGKAVYLESSMDLTVWSQFPLEVGTSPSYSPYMVGDGKMHQLTIPIEESRMFFRTSCEDLGSTPPQ